MIMLEVGMMYVDVRPIHCVNQVTERRFSIDQILSVKLISLTPPYNNSTNIVTMPNYILFHNKGQQLYSTNFTCVQLPTLPA